MPQNIDSILGAAEQQEASDVFLQENEIPRLKVNEQIGVLGEEPLSLAQISDFWQACGGNPNGDGDMDRDTGFVSRTHTRYRVACTAPWADSVRSCAVSRPKCPV